MEQDPTGGRPGPRPGRRLRDRLVRGGLLAAAVAAVVALDTGAVALPYSTPGAAPSRSGLAAGSSSGGVTRVPTGERARDAAVETALATMTQAYAARDERRFLSVADPAQTALVGRLRTTYRNLRAIGYQEVRFGWAARQTWPVPLSRPYSSPHAAVLPVVASVEVTTRLDGFDRRAASSVLGLTFAERSGRWLVVADRDAAGELEEYADSEPWMLGTVFVVRTAHTVVVGEPSRAADVKRLAKRVESAVRTVRSVWKMKSWNGRAVVYATTQRRFVDRHFGGRDARGDESGSEAVFDAKVLMLYAKPVVDGDDTPQSATPRMVVTPFLLARDNAQSRAVLRHELTHVAFAFEGNDAAPAWLVEGTAEYTGFRTGGSGVDGVGALARRGMPRATWSQLSRGTWKPRLVADPTEFYEGSGSAVSDAYTTAWLTCLYIADKYGEQSLLRLYAAAATMSPDNDPEAVEAAVLKKTLETDRKRLLKDVKRYSSRIRSRFV